MSLPDKQLNKSQSWISFLYRTNIFTTIYLFVFAVGINKSLSFYSLFSAKTHGETFFLRVKYISLSLELLGGRCAQWQWLQKTSWISERILKHMTKSRQVNVNGFFNINFLYQKYLWSSSYKWQMIHNWKALRICKRIANFLKLNFFAKSGYKVKKSKKW